MSHIDSCYLCMILAFDEVNDFLAASEHSNINGANVILTGLWYCSQTVIRIIFHKLKFNFGLRNKSNILFQFMCNTIFDIYAWNLSRFNYVPDVASYLQLFDYLWELQQFLSWLEYLPSLEVIRSWRADKFFSKAARLQQGKESHLVWREDFGYAYGTKFSPGIWVAWTHVFVYDPGFWWSKWLLSGIRTFYH